MMPNRVLLDNITFGSTSHSYFSLSRLAESIPEIHRLPICTRILLENLMRHEDGVQITRDHVRELATRRAGSNSPLEIPFHPSRIVMQDYSGLVAIADLATMREKCVEIGADASRVNPLKPVDLIVDHSLSVVYSGHRRAGADNLSLEYEQNAERYSFLKWAQRSFSKLRVIPPGKGIIHQINLEHLCRGLAFDHVNGRSVVSPETVIGTDSHTPMINGLGVLGWGTGGIEAEAAMMGEPISILAPNVIGIELSGQLSAGVMASDLALFLANRLRQVGIVDCFVEFFGAGVRSLSVEDRATVANMAPEYGATCAYFPVDDATLQYLQKTGRGTAARSLKEYAFRQGLWHADAESAEFSERIEIDLSKIPPCVAGPSKPHQWRPLGRVFEGAPHSANDDEELTDGDVVIAAITSCTNTSNPRAMIAAGLLAKRAADLGLGVRGHVKTSLAPGSQVVARYLEAAGLMPALEKLGFFQVGYGCTTCVGNSGPLNPGVADVVKAKNLTVASVLCGNRNFEGRIHPLVKANYLMSPAMVVAYAIAGNVRLNIADDPLGFGKSGLPVYLKDIWPSEAEIQELSRSTVTESSFGAVYETITDGGELWDALPVQTGSCFPWAEGSTYIGPSPLFSSSEESPRRAYLKSASPLIVLGDDVTTDHISPVGTIGRDSPAAKYLIENGVPERDFNSYGARRANAAVMIRGGFASPRLQNELVPGLSGPSTKIAGTDASTSIFNAAMHYSEMGTPLVIVAGRNYGTGSARDWAAKATKLLGVRAVLAESFERIHRANLVLMGVLPLEFQNRQSRRDFAVQADTKISIEFASGRLAPRQNAIVTFRNPEGLVHRISMRVRIDTDLELNYFASNGVLPHILRKLSQH